MKPGVAPSRARCVKAKWAKTATAILCLHRRPIRERCHRRVQCRHRRLQTWPLARSARSTMTTTTHTTTKLLTPATAVRTLRRHRDAQLCAGDATPARAARAPTRSRSSTSTRRRPARPWPRLLVESDDLCPQRRQTTTTTTTTTTTAQLAKYLTVRSKTHRLAQVPAVL
jgi:hypothetical protein